MKEKNVKHLTKTLAVVSLLTPITAHPLGIGGIELHSALNQKLNAEIRLNVAPGENPDDISVRLAPPEIFDKAGIPWNYFLSKIKFEPVVQANGSIVVKVTSREALTEPFLDFLIEVIWPQGSQFREFTVLIDPPAGYHPPTIPSAATSDFRVHPLLEEEIQKPVQKPRPAKRHIASAKPASNITPQTPTSGEYGPTQNNDTLWNIAKRLGSERGVPANKMMTALYQANPSAFNHDIDALKTGAILRIPETEAILGSGAPRGEKIALKETSPESKAATPETKALELVAPTDTKITDTTRIDEQSKPGAESGAPGAAAGGGEETATSGKDLELQSRVDRLEQQLNMMQQLLALKDQQLSALQSHDQEAARRAAEQAQTLPSAPALPPAVTGQPPAPEQPTIAPTQPEQAVKPTPVQPKPPKPVAPAESEGDLLSSPAYYLTIGGLGAGILGMLGWLWWRRREGERQTNTDSMFASASQIRLPDSDSSLSVPVIDMNAPGSYDVGTVGESSFISDFTPSDFEAFDTDQGEVDPMSEADVYLAYGRYQQAEDLMRHAIHEHPGKDDYKLKLLEIFYANENKDRFAAYAKELADDGKTADRPFWSKVSDMAREIIPESPLFGGLVTPSHKKIETGKADVQVEQKATLASKHDTGADATTEDRIDEAESGDNSLDFDLDMFSDKSEPQKQSDSEATADIESVDFDLSSLPVEAPAEDTAKASPDDLETFDFNFDFDTDSSSETGKEPSLESFDFSGLGSIGEEAKPTASKPESTDLNLDTPSEFDFNFDFAPPSKMSSDEELNLGVADLTDMDEFETKIDLAKAYIDMGDAAAAKSIAEEVLEKGNPEQKQAAQAILDEIK